MLLSCKGNCSSCTLKQTEGQHGLLSRDCDITTNALSYCYHRGRAAVSTSFTACLIFSQVTELHLWQGHAQLASKSLHGPVKTVDCCTSHFCMRWGLMKHLKAKTAVAFNTHLHVLLSQSVSQENPQASHASHTDRTWPPLPPRLGRVL